MKLKITKKSQTYLEDEINKLANVKHIKFGKALFLGKKTGPSLDDNIKISVAIGTLV